MLTRADVLCVILTTAGFCLILPGVSTRYQLDDWTIAGLVCLLIAAVLAGLIFHTEIKKTSTTTEGSPK